MFLSGISESSELISSPPLLLVIPPSAFRAVCAPLLAESEARPSFIWLSLVCNLVLYNLATQNEVQRPGHFLEIWPLTLVTTPPPPTRICLLIDFLPPPGSICILIGNINVIGLC